MGLFNKIKNVLFEEEEVEEEVASTPEVKINNRDNLFKSPEVEHNEYRPMPERNLEVKPKEPTFEKVEPNDFSERELFRSESTFKFPAFDEDEFNTSMPKLKVDEPVKEKPANDFTFRKKEERRSEYSRLDNFKVKEEVKEEKKRFKPSPVISPVYGILDKDYKVEDIKEAPKNVNNNVSTSKDLDVESVRAKAFGKLENNLERSVRKSVVSKETYEIKNDEPKEVFKEETKVKDKKEEVIITDEPILDDSHNLIEERAKTIDELLKDASDEVIDANVTDEIDDTDEITFDDDEINEVIDEEKPSKNVLEDDTLENDLYDLIDSMYDNTEEGE